MNKETFYWILECSLLAFDGLTKEEIIKLGAEPTEAEAGIRLCNYLKGIKVKQEATYNES